MSFHNESAMVSKLKYLIPTNSRSKTFEEVNLGYGVADLVIVGIDQNINQEIVPSYAINILNVIRNGPKSYNEIVSLTKNSHSLVNKAIDYLNKSNFILDVDGWYQVKETYKFVITSAIAIEAKLSDWKRALYQAYRYKWFANYSFVCLPEEKVHLALNNISLFQTYEVGIMSIGDSIKYHYQPDCVKPFDDLMYMSLNEKVKQTLI